MCLLVPDQKTGELTIYCANAGDSRAVAGVNGKAQALSFDHKPKNATERQRI